RRLSSTNTASIMHSVPGRHRRVASGMRVTFQNVGMPLSIRLFFTLMIVGLNSTVPAALFSGLTANGVPAALAHQLAARPPISYLFASFLGYNPLATLLGPVLGQLPPADVANLTGRTFFPSLISGPFQHGLVLVLGFSIAASLVAAVASALRGGRYIHEEARRSGGGGVMEEKEIGVRTSDGTMTTFIAHPDGGGPFPVAMLFMDGVGYREQIKQNARRFASGGYYVVAPDLFYRAGDRIAFDFSSIASAVADSDARRRMVTVISTVTPDAAVSDTRAGVAEV